jgi:malate dehydrogenase (oxaloacetate-decarboxylating)(NADP+)
MDVIRDPRKYKGTRWTPEEREAAGVTGLVPYGEAEDMDTAVGRVLWNLEQKADDLQRYCYLMTLKERDEDLFYAAAIRHTKQVMPLVYTPTVGAACQRYGDIDVPRSGMWLSIKDAGRLAERMSAWAAKGTVKAICVTDGERILGLGDLGAHGHGIPVGKLALYTVCAGVPPEACLPITLDVGTNKEEFLADPRYLGVRERRVTGDAYDAFIAEFVSAAKATFGDHVLIQWEDFGNHNAFTILNEYMDKCTSFNDDIQGTASVVVAGLMAAARLTGTSMADNKYLFLGAGEAGVGIADLIAYSTSLETGRDIEECRDHIWLVDSKGLVTADRAAAGGLQHHKLRYAHETAVAFDQGLEGLVRELKPTVLMGVSAQAGAFTEGVCKAMGEVNAMPTIFALSNPTSKAECTAEQAYTWTEGRCLFASGSPFDTVTLADGTVKVPGQGNNAYIFPGVGLGVLACEATRVSDHTFFVAAKTLAGCVTEEDLASGCLYPPLSKIREVSAMIAEAVVEEAYATGVAALSPKPEDVTAHVHATMYNPNNSSRSGV